MAGRARDDGRVRLRSAIRVPGSSRWPGRGPVAVSLLAGMVLAGMVLAGCSSGVPAARTAAGGGPASSAGAASASPGPRGTGRSISISNGPAGAATAIAGGSGAQPGCARWPAGSTRATLLITQASNGRRYCVRTGQTVQVYLAGSLSPTAGSEPPRLTGTALVPARARRARLLRSPAAAYLAVRAGSAVLTIVRLPCHSIRPQATPGAAMSTGELGRAGAGISGNAAEMAYTGGAPVGVQCASEQVLRVTVAVT